MPVYEYECAKCGTRFEELEKMSAPPLKTHNGCGGRVKRLPSAPAIQFKGSGWYVTDYAKRSGSADSKDGKKAESKSEAKSESKTESKNGSDKVKTESKTTEKSTKS